MEPKTFLVGFTSMDKMGVADYLRETGNQEFLHEIEESSLSGGECLCSFYAKLCYKSLTEGKNANVTRIRSIADNLESVFNSKHGSVFEHFQLNFVTTNCSRVFTHELVRHRVGTAFSQTSGRYVAIDHIDMVLPPDLQDQKITFRYANNETREMTARELVETEAGHLADVCKQLRDNLIKPDDDFATKKRITSAIRRLAPNGQTNEIGWSCNIRSLRHMIEMRTSRHAEWEIRLVFNQVAAIVLKRWPMMMYGHQAVDTGDGLIEYTNLKV